MTAPLVDVLEDAVAEVLEEHDADPTELRARVAQKIGAALKARGFDPDPDIEATAVSRWPVN